MTRPTPDVRAVLLVPEEGDPYGLLREGPCGARPPTARRFWESETSSRLWSVWYASGRELEVAVPKEQRALVLAWDGEVVGQAYWRPVNRWTYLRDEIDHMLFMGRGPSARLLELLGTLGTPVFLGADGRDVTQDVKSV